MQNKSYQRFAIATICVAVIILLEYVFFHNVIGTDACLGDSIDGRLTALISEHWYRFFIGEDTLTEVGGMFYPMDNVLSYSDILLGVGLIHSLLRVFGIGIFQAYKYSLIIIHLSGAIGLFIYLNLLKRINPVASFLAVICFSYTHIMQVQTTNTQLFCVSALVFELIFIHYMIHSDKKGVRIVNAVLVAIFMALQFYTAYYVAFMGALQFLIIAVVFIVTYLIRDREYLLSLLKRWYEFVLCIVIFALSMIPFLMLYLPEFNSGSRLQYELVYVTQLEDLFYDGLDKLPGSVIGGYNVNYCSVSHAQLFPYITAIAVGVILVICIVCMIIRRRIDKAVRPYVIVALAVSVAIIFAIGIKINDFSIWEIIYDYFPGAQVIRSQIRWELVLTLPCAILIAFMADYIYKSFTGAVRIVAMIITIAVTGLIWYDNFEPTGVLSSYSSKDSEKFISYVAAPPSDCEVFYIKNGRVYFGNTFIDEVTPLIPWGGKINIDALYISTLYDLKTFNGYSGRVPSGWDIMGVVGDDTDAEALNWIRHNNISTQGLYAYDMRDNVWEQVELSD